MKKPVFLIDTREQKPFRFPPEITIWKTGLKVGDYSVKGWDKKGGIVIERKSLNDFFLTMIKHRERFNRELKLMQDYRFKAVIIEADYPTICRGIEWSQSKGGFLYTQFLQDCMRYGISPIFSSYRLEAQRMTLELLLAWHQADEKGMLVEVKENNIETLGSKLRKFSKKKSI